jgi:hypothetical protein
MSTPAPEPETSGSDVPAKKPRTETLLPALGFAALVCAVWYAYFKINTEAPPAEPKVVLPPVERPQTVVGDIYVPNPERTWKNLRPFGSAAFGVYPTRAATFITAGFGLPPYLDSEIREDAPLVGAIAVDDRGTYWVLGAAVLDGRALLAELTEGDDPYFFKEEHLELGLSLVQPKPGRTPVALTLAISGDMVLVAEDDEQLLKLGPYVARNLPPAAQGKGKGKDIVVEIEPARLSRQLRSLVKAAPAFAMDWISGVKKANVTATVTPDQLSMSAELSLDEELRRAVQMLEPGPAGPLLSLSKSSAVSVLVQGLLPADVVTRIAGGQADEKLQRGAQSLADHTGPPVTCMAEGTRGAGVLCQTPSDDGAKAAKALADLALVFEAPRWRDMLREQTGLQILRPAKRTPTLLGLTAVSEATGEIALAWRANDHELLLAFGIQPLPELSEQLSHWAPSKDLLHSDKVVRDWFPAKTRVHAAAVLRPGQLVTARAMAREEAALAVWLEPAAPGVRVQLRAERDAVRFLTAIVP